LSRMLQDDLKKLTERVEMLEHHHKNQQQQIADLVKLVSSQNQARETNDANTKPAGIDKYKSNK
jgi:uncharacterized protein (UPF0335 family)